MWHCIFLVFYFFQGWRCIRHQHTGGQRKSGSGTAAIALGVSGVTASVIGVVGYAAFSEENRKVSFTTKLLK